MNPLLMGMCIDLHILLPIFWKFIKKFVLKFEGNMSIEQVLRL